MTVEKRTFTDANGYTWDVTFTLGAARRVDNSDFSELTDKEFSILSPDRALLLEILTDTPLCFAIVWAMVQPQVKDQMGLDVSKEDEAAQAEDLFLEGLDGNAIEAGREALWGGLADFFPENRTALLMLQEQVQRARRKVDKKIGKMGQQVESYLDQQINQLSEKAQKELKDLGKQPGKTSSA